MKSYMASQATVPAKWYIIDATGKTLGRLAARIAYVLRGKNKPQYTPHADIGDHIIVINADHLKVTGRKAGDKMYYRHSGYMGGLKEATYNEMQAKRPGRVLEIAVEGMLEHNPLGRRQFAKLKVYAGAEHPHIAQQPEKLDI